MEIKDGDGDLTWYYKEDAIRIWKYLDTFGWMTYQPKLVFYFPIGILLASSLVSSLSISLVSYGLWQQNYIYKLNPLIPSLNRSNKIKADISL